MKKRGLLKSAPPALALFAGLIWSAAALADEPVLTKAPVASAPAASSTCQGVPDFFLGTCQLAWYGVRFYGVIDVGGGYQTHGAPWDPNFPQGSSYLVQKMNRASMWTQAPNGLSRSSVGILVDEPFAPGWKFVGQLEAGFDPYSLRLANGPASIADNRGVPLDLQTSNNDSSHAGQVYNSVGYLGVTSDVLGTSDLFPSKRIYAGRGLCLRPDGRLLCVLGARLLELQLRRRRHRNLPHNHRH